MAKRDPKLKCQNFVLKSCACFVECCHRLPSLAGCGCLFYFLSFFLFHFVLFCFVLFCLVLRLLLLSPQELLILSKCD